MPASVQDHAKRGAHVRADPSGARALAALACLLWLGSLWLPGFRIAGSVTDFQGWMALVAGSVFAVFVHGWAVYANVFFVWVVVLLFAGRRATWSVFAMLALLATLPMFRGTLQDEGSGQIVPVASWGWGAVLWIVALLLTAVAAALRSGSIGRRAASASVVLILAGCLPVIVLHVRQSSIASAQDRYAFLSPGLAFTREPLCGVDPVAVKAPLLPEGAIVTLDVDLGIGPLSALHPALPPFPDMQRGGKAWVTHRLQGQAEGALIRVPYRADRPVLHVRGTRESTVLTLLDRPGGRPLYSQTLRQVQGVDGLPRSCPASRHDLPDGRDRPAGYDDHLRRAVGQDRKRPLSPVALTPGLADTRCDVELVGDGVSEPNVRYRGRIEIGTTPVSWSTALCSDRHIVLLRIKRAEGSDQQKPMVSARVFDRITLEPQAAFFDPGTCARDGCPRTTHADAIRAVRIEERALVAVTDAGEIRVSR